MSIEKATPHSCSCTASKVVHSSGDAKILSDFERGSWYAAVAFGAMLLFLAFGAVMWGW